MRQLKFFFSSPYEIHHLSCKHLIIPYTFRIEGGTIISRLLPSDLGAMNQTAKDLNTRRSRYRTRWRKPQGEWWRETHIFWVKKETVLCQLTRRTPHANSVPLANVFLSLWCNRWAKKRSGSNNLKENMFCSGVMKGLKALPCFYTGLQQPH